MRNSLQSLTRSWANSVERTGKALSVLIDYMVANDITVACLQDKEDPKRKTIDAGIVASFSKSDQYVLITPTKELSDVQKGAKRYAHQQLGSRRSKIIKALGDRLNPVERGPVERKPDDIWFRDWYNSGLKRAETSEGADDLDIVEITEWLAKSPFAK